jgi:hypothetical protein
MRCNRSLQVFELLAESACSPGKPPLARSQGQVLAKRKGSDHWPEPCYSFLRDSLVEGVRNVREGSVEVAADAGDGQDDRDRNAGGDQTVFDRRRAVLVAKEITKLSHRGSLGFQLAPPFYLPSIFPAFPQRPQFETFSPCPLTFIIMVSE